MDIRRLWLVISSVLAGLLAFLTNAEKFASLSMKIYGHYQDFTERSGLDFWDFFRGGRSSLKEEKASADARRNFLVGDLTLLEHEVKKNQELLLQQGHRVLHQGTPSPLFNSTGISIEAWPKTWPTLARKLSLDPSMTQLLELAAELPEIKEMPQSLRCEGLRCFSRLEALYTVRHAAASRIDVTYGSYEASIEVSAEGVSFPAAHCVQWEGRTFTVLPTAHPYQQGVGLSEDQWFEIPPGWTVADPNDPNVADIVTNVIQPHHWHTNEMVLLDLKRLMYHAWHTAGWPKPDAGRFHSSAAMHHWIQWVDDRFRFTVPATRLLIEQKQQMNEELQNLLKKHVEMQARAQWAQQLGLLPDATS